MTTEQDYRVAIGAYVLGGLEPHEAIELEAHLGGCPDCQQELAEFSDTAAQLALVPRDLLAQALEGHAAPAPAGPTDDLLLQRTLRQVRAEQTGSRRRRWLAVAAAVCALVAAPVITAVAVSNGDGGQTIASAPTPSVAAGRTVQASDAATGVSGVATLSSAPWGTKLQAKFTGEPHGATCQLLVISKAGERQVAGTWVVTDAAATAGTNIQGSVSIKDTDIARLEVRTTTGQQLLTITA
jgi:anti-sigma factor RsiW